MRRLKSSKSKKVLGRSKSTDFVSPDEIQLPTLEGRLENPLTSDEDAIQQLKDFGALVESKQIDSPTLVKSDISPGRAKEEIAANLEESRKELASLKLRMNFITKEEYQESLEKLQKINHNSIKMMEKI
jgi:hypothetical protein